MYLTGLSVAIILLGALIVLYQAQRGQKIGFIRSAMQVAVVVVSAVCATFMSDWLSFIFEGAAENLLRNVGITDTIDGSLGNSGGIVSLVSAPIAAILLYIPMFFALFGIFSVVVKLVYDNHISNSETNRGDYPAENAPFYERESKKLGLACGILGGVILTVVVMSPLAGVLKTAGGAASIVENLTGNEISDSAEYRDFERYSNDVMVSAVYVMGGRPLFDMTSMLKGNSGRVTIRNELENINSLAKDDIDGILSIGFRADDISSMKKLLEHSEKSVVIEAVVYSTVTGAFREWGRGNEYMGVDNPINEYTPAYAVLSREIFSACANSNAKSFYQNCNTIFNLVNILDNANVSSGGDYQSKLTMLVNGNSLDMIAAELEKNSNMQSAVYEIDRVLMRVIAKEVINNGAYSYDERYKLYEDIAEAVNITRKLDTNKKISDLADYIDDAFIEMGMPLPSGVSKQLGQRIIDEIYTANGVYSWQIENFFLSYVDTQPNYTDGIYN